ncbi:MAG: protein kinase [Myxococcota bacterium]|nr:protein kinase [Myxococcota bacterium]
MSETDPNQLTIHAPSGEETWTTNRKAPPMGDDSLGISAVRSGLHAEEAARAQTIGFVFALIGVLVLIWTPFLSGHPPLRWSFFTIMFLFTLSGLRVGWLASDPKRYTQWTFRWFGCVAVLASTVALAYLGPFSPTALAVTLGIGFFGQGSDRVGAWCICGSAILLCLLMMSLIVLGLGPDVGVFRGTEAGLSGQFFMTLMVPVVLFVTLMQATWSGRAVQSALQTAVESAVEANRKGVQFEEAQAELDRIFAAGGIQGQYSGENIGVYRLGPLLGRGGSGEVYDAVHRNDNRRAAIKIIRCNESDDTESHARFEREGKITMSLRSRNIVRVEQYGRTPTGHLFIAMERLKGSDLAAILRSEGQLEPRVVLPLVEDVCLALAEAHRTGVIHRDIKPHNLFQHQEPDGRSVWKVLDFGVSRWAESSATITKGGVVGTPQYMSPEQARGDTLDYRADIYAMGAVLYRALTGRPPFRLKGASALYAAATERPARPRAVAPELDKQVEAVLALAMSPSKNERFQTIQELHRAYVDAVQGILQPEVYIAANRIPWRKATGDGKGA